MDTLILTTYAEAEARYRAARTWQERRRVEIAWSEEFKRRDDAYSADPSNELKRARMMDWWSLVCDICGAGPRGCSGIHQ